MSAGAQYGRTVPLSGLVDDVLAAPLAGCTVGSPDAQVVMVEWSDPGGPEAVGRLIAPLHVHDRADEVWYVLSGRLGFRVGERRLEAGPGSAVFGPRGVPHTAGTRGASRCGTCS
jgi:mannose-6-phosphate isomerase-like protein (cupin superfamily)